MSNHVAFYTRSSTGNLLDLKRQRKVLQREFDKRKIEFTNSSITVYEDTEYCGLQNGPSLERLIQDIRLGKINIVMVSRLNRISRSVKGLQAFYNLIDRCHFRFICENENIDSIYWPEKSLLGSESGVQ